MMSMKVSIYVIWAQEDVFVEGVQVRVKFYVRIALLSHVLVPDPLKVLATVGKCEYVWTRCGEADLSTVVI